MAKKKSRPQKNNDVEGLLTDLLITQLASAGIQAQTIRKIVACDINRVSRITKHIKAARRAAASSES